MALQMPIREAQVADTNEDRLSDPKQAYYAHEAREFLRKRLIGKHVKVQVDFIRPRDGEYEERECATIRYGNQHAYVSIICYPLECPDMLSRNVAEQIIEKGLASVVRHRRDDEDRSPDYDKLMAAEQTWEISMFVTSAACIEYILQRCRR